MLLNNFQTVYIELTTNWTKANYMPFYSIFVYCMHCFSLKSVIPGNSWEHGNLFPFPGMKMIRESRTPTRMGKKNIFHDVINTGFVAFCSEDFFMAKKLWANISNHSQCCATNLMCTTAKLSAIYFSIKRNALVTGNGNDWSDPNQFFSSFSSWSCNIKLQCHVLFIVRTCAL